jgi:hypothetical protein
MATGRTVKEKKTHNVVVDKEFTAVNRTATGQLLTVYKRY